MTSGRRFGARTLRRQPLGTTLLAPERDVTSGSYVPGLRHDDKRHRDDDRDRHGDDRGRPRGPRSAGPTRVRSTAGALSPPVLVVAVAAVVIAAGAVVWATRGSDGARSEAAATTTGVASSPLTASGSGVSGGIPPGGGATVSDASAAVADVPVAGSYSWTMVVTDGNEHFPVGTSTSSAVSFQATCADPGCPISSPQYNGATFTLAGGVYRAAFTTQEPCPTAAGIQVADDVTVELAPAGGAPGGPAERLTGTQTMTSHTEGCTGSVSDPVTWSIDAVRTG